jgi:hypothetical protein
MSTPTTILQLDKPAVGGDADVWGGLLNINFDDLDIFVAKPRWKKNAPAVGATTPIDLALANFFEFTVSQATSLVFSNVPATLPDGTVPATRVLLKITNGGAFALTFPGSVVWPGGGTAPTFAAAGVEFVGLVSYDAGTTWYVEILHLKTTGVGDLDQAGKLRSRIGGSTVLNRVAHTGYTSANRTVTGTPEQSISSYSLPANALDRNGAGVRIVYAGTGAGNNGAATAVLKFGATNIAVIALPNGAIPFRIEAFVIRRAASSQRYSVFTMYDSGGGVMVTTLVSGNLTENETGAITIDFRSNPGNAGVSTTLNTAAVQTLDPDTTQVA